MIDKGSLFMGSVGFLQDWGPFIRGGSTFVYLDSETKELRGENLCLLGAFSPENGFSLVDYDVMFWRAGPYYPDEEPPKTDKGFIRVETPLCEPPEELTGGSVSYYKIMEKPKTLDGDHYIECKDIQYHYKMESHLSQAFKACWRIAAAKQGMGKKGGSVVYDCEKAVQFSVDMLRQEKSDMSGEEFKEYLMGMLG